MSKKATIGLVFLPIILALSVLIMIDRSSQNSPSDYQSATVPSTAQADRPAVPKSPVPDTTTLEFEKSVGLNEPVTVDIRFRDYSQLPYEYTDYLEEVSKLPAIPGKATLTFRKFDMVDSLGVFRPEPGHQIVYVTYEISGHEDNPEGDRIMPNLPFSGDPDMAPQPVLVSGDQTFRVDNQDFVVLKNALYLDHPTHMKFSASGPWTYGAAWERPVDRLPIVALEYMTPEGERRLIKLDY